MKRSYKQNCTLAHSLDLVGERWTLLIVRELLGGPKRYGELGRNLPGMGTNLLATRLKELLAEELLSHDRGLYRLTNKGMGLEPVVHALVRFGFSMNTAQNAEYLHRDEWDAVALKALYNGERGPTQNGRYQLALDGVPFCIDKSGLDVRITQEECSNPVVGVSLSKDVARRIATGEVRVSSAISGGDVSVTGNRKDARALLDAFGST